MERLTAANVDNEVTLNGWVHRQRDFGDLVFIDLRDRTGLVQVVVDKTDVPELVAPANSVRSEFVLSVRGIVRQRRAGSENPNLATGEIEVAAKAIEVLNTAKTLPFPVSDEAQMANVDETLRLKHRYIDLRRPKMYQMLELRHRAVKRIRDLMDARGLSSRSKRPSSPKARRKARATIWFPTALSRASSTPCRSRRSSTSSC